MAGESFDGFSRALGAATSRRQMLKLALGALTGGAFARAGGPLSAPPAAAAVCPPEEFECHPQGNDSFRCCPTGASCAVSSLSVGTIVCCVGAAVPNPATEGVDCVCSSHTASSGILCQTSSNSFTCCPTHADCEAHGNLGVCVCQDGYAAGLDANGSAAVCCQVGVAHPDNGQCVCDGTNLPVNPDGSCGQCGPDNCKGCCDATGACRVDTDGHACGAGGAACVACPAHSVCSFIPGHGQEPGGQCLCDGTGQPPAGNTCPDHCGPDTCPNNCCLGPICTAAPAYASTGLCGSGGGTCQTCPRDGSAPCRNGQCTCLSNGLPLCNGRCCPPGATCQGGGLCICTATGKPPVFNSNGQPQCPICANCSDGCCLVDETIYPLPPNAAVCYTFAGQSASTCGANGDVCIRCGENQTCKQGVCVCTKTGQPPKPGERCPGCGPCLDGCCDATLNCIQPAQQTNAQCGQRGETCVVCPAGAVCQDYISNAFGHPNLGQQCVCSTSGQPVASGGVCPCSAGRCPSGCCDGTNCQPGTSNTACGSAGGTCIDCTVTGATCQNGTCVGGTCLPVRAACTSSAQCCDRVCCNVNEGSTCGSNAVPGGVCYAASAGAAPCDFDVDCLVLPGSAAGGCFYAGRNSPHWGICVRGKPLGAACGVNTDCASGGCSAGVCVCPSPQVPVSLGSGFAACCPSGTATVCASQPPPPGQIYACCTAGSFCCLLGPQPICCTPGQTCTASGCQGTGVKGPCGGPCTSDSDCKGGACVCDTALGICALAI